MIGELKQGGWSGNAQSGLILVVSANPKRRDADPVITFQSQGRIQVNVWNVLQDVDQDGDGVYGMSERLMASSANPMWHCTVVADYRYVR